MIWIAVRKCRMCEADFDVPLQNKNKRNNLYCDKCMPLVQFKKDIKSDDCEAAKHSKHQHGKKTSNVEKEITLIGEMLPDENPYAKLPHRGEQQPQRHPTTSVSFSQVSDSVFDELDSIDMSKFGL